MRRRFVVSSFDFRELSRFVEDFLPDYKIAILCEIVRGLSTDCRRLARLVLRFKRSPEDFKRFLIC